MKAALSLMVAGKIRCVGCAPKEKAYIASGRRELYGKMFDVFQGKHTSIGHVGETR
jgi:hypothetical protein